MEPAPSFALMFHSRPLCGALAIGLAVLGCGGRVPDPPPPVPVAEPATSEDSSLRELLGAEPLRVGPALAPAVEHTPTTVAEGTAFLITVRPAEGSAPIAVVEGTAADRALIFVPGPGGLFWTVAPAPLDARALGIELTVTYLGGAERRETGEIPVTPRDFPSENLRVARRFTRPSPQALKRIQAERALVAQTVRQIAAKASWREPFIRPREDRTTSAFGTRRLLNGELRSRHLGHDIHGRTGDPIYASNRGRVALARDLYFSGNSVYLDHGLGLYTAYFHMSEILVEEGAWVEQGQLIGRVGSTGRVTGPHVHWSVSFQGIPLDPEALLVLGAAPAAEPAAEAAAPVP